MPNFVYDATSLPYPKQDSRALLGGEDPNKNVLASEWNTLNQAAADLRAALLAGKYWALADDGAVAGAAGKVFFRSQGGKLEISQNGGSYEPLRLGALGVIDVTDKGAVGDGDADDTEAFQDAIDEAADQILGLPKAVKIPGGMKFLINDTLLIENVKGIAVYSDNERSGTIVTGDAMAGKPVFKVVNCRDSRFEKFSIESDGTHRPTGFECWTEDPSGPTISTRNKFIDLYLYDLAYGVRMRCKVGQDSNNDLHHFERCNFSALTVAGVSIEHSNSLRHELVKCHFDCPIAYKVTGGSFVSDGCWTNVSDVILDLSGGFTVYHPIQMKNCGQETGNTGTTEGKLVRTDGEYYEVLIDAFEQQGGPTDVDYIDFQAAGRFSLLNSRIQIGQADVRANFPNSATVVDFSGNQALGITDIVWDCDLVLRRNNWVPGTVTETPGSNAKLLQIADSGAQYDSEVMRTLGVQVKILGGLPANDTGIDTFFGSSVTRLAGYLWGVHNNGAVKITLDYAGALRLLAGDLYVNQIRDMGNSGAIRVISVDGAETGLLGARPANQGYANILANGTAQNAGEIITAIRRTFSSGDCFLFTTEGRLAIRNPFSNGNEGIDLNGTLWLHGSGSPEGVVAAPPGSLYSRTDDPGGSAPKLFSKDTGTETTGWVAAY